jgi:hypothetical protein
MARQIADIVGHVLGNAGMASSDDPISVNTQKSAPLEQRVGVTAQHHIAPSQAT